MRLMRMQLKNFKGATDVTIAPIGQDHTVYGDNGTGKTTLVDAVCWLLTGMDSGGKASFEIKTLDHDGKEINNLEHEVEGVFISNDAGMKVTLKKLMVEKWTKKRGQATPDFSGHTTSYYIDDVPMSEGDYRQRITQMIGDDKTVRMLTIPGYFAASLPWLERRRTLLDICGQISDQEIIDKNSDLSDLPTILAGRSVDDHKKVLNATRSKINDDLKKVPVQIAEVKRSMVDVSEEPEEEIRLAIERITSLIDKNESTRASMVATGGAAEKKAELSDVQAEISAIQAEIKDGHAAIVRGKKDEIADLTRKVSTITSEITNLTNTRAQLTTKIATATATRDKLRQEFYQAQDTKIECGVCKTCGQELPADIVAEATAKANESLANTLADIETRGLEAKAEQDQAERGIEDIEEAISNLKTKQAEINTLLDRLNEALSLLESKDIFSGVKALSDLVAVNNALALEVEAIINGEKSADTTAITMEIDRLRADRGEAQGKLNSILKNKASEQRVAELMATEKDLAGQFEQCERELFMIEKFIRAKVSFLEQSVNSQFSMVSFKLFKEQINGGLAECCDVTVDGVPYSTGLNTGARINANIDIINTLSRHYGVHVPVFVDNCESVTSLIPCDSQVIRLVVSATDKALRFENTNMQEAA